MTVQRWTYEGQPNGTTVTRTNIADHGDPALNTGVTTVVTGSASGQYSTAHPSGGAVGVAISATTPDTVVMRTPNWTAVDRAAWQQDFYLTAYPSASIALARWRNTSGSQAQLLLGTDGKLYVTDNNAGTVLVASTALPLNTLVRVNARAVIGAANNNSTFAWAAKRVSDGTSIDSKSSTALNLNDAAASPALLVCGDHGKPGTGGTVSGLHIDNSAWDDGASAFMADPSNPLVITATPTPSTGTSPQSVSLALGATGGSGTTVTYVVDWGDGSADTTTTTTPVTHTYASPGDYVGTVTGTNA